MSVVSRCVAALVVAMVGVLGLAVPAGAESAGIDGYITNVRTEEPVQAFVTAFNSSGGYSGGVSTDEGGYFDLDFLSPGEYRLRVTAIDYVEQWSFGKAFLDEADPVVSPGTASMALTPVDYGSLAGRFVSGSGAPVPNSLVELRSLNDNWVDNASTDANGAFRFGHLVVGGYKLRFSGPTGISQWSYQKTTFAEADVITVAAAAETNITETAFDGGDLEITVVDNVTGAPVAGAYLASNDPQLIAAVTDADGRAVFPGITPGTYRVTIAPPDGYLYGSIEEVVVRANEKTTVTTPLTAKSLLSITMRDAQTGAVVPGACVVVLDERARGVVWSDRGACADSQGRIQLDYYWPDRYRLFAYATDGVHGSQWVGAHSGTGDLERAAWFSLASHVTTEVTVRLDQAGSISGVVTAADGGAPVSGLCPSVTPVWAYSFTPINVQCTGADGRYTISGLGPYKWRVQYPDYSGAYAWVWSGGAADRFGARPIAVRPGMTTTVDARLPVGGKLTGHIIGATLPVQYISVDATNARTGDFAAPSAIIRTGAEYTLSGLATQRVILEYSSRWGGGDPTRYPDPVSVKAGAITYLDLP